MGPEIISFVIQAIVIALITGSVGLLVGRTVLKVSEKLDKVLGNQQSMEVKMAEVKKDIHSISDESKRSAIRLDGTEQRLTSIEIDVSALNEFKRNIENEKN